MEKLVKARGFTSAPNNYTFPDPMGRVILGAAALDADPDPDPVPGAVLDPVPVPGAVLDPVPEAGPAP